MTTERMASSKYQAYGAAFKFFPYLRAGFSDLIFKL